jgi:hypothetical protein
MSSDGLDPDYLIHHALKAGPDGADQWMEEEAQLWSEESGVKLNLTKGVIARWLHFFALFKGNGVAEQIRRLYGRYMEIA